EGATEAPTFHLHPASVLVGLVTDREGEPISGATVTARELSESRRWGGRAETRTRGDGSFRLDGLSLDVALEIQTVSVGHITDRQTLDPFTAGEVRSGFEARLDATLNAVGRVVDVDDKPVAGAVVELGPQPPSGDLSTLFQRMRESGDPESTTTDAEGRFRLGNLEPQTYRLQVTAAGFAMVKVPGLEIPADVGEHDLGVIVVAPGVSIEGRVTDADGGALTGAVVKSQPSGRDLTAMVENRTRAPVEATADVGGRFRFDDLTPGQALQLRLELEGYAAEPTDVVTPAAGEDTLAVTLVMEPAAELAVQVADGDGQPLHGARISINPTGGNRYRAKRASTDEDGVATVTELVPGRFDLEVSFDGYRSLRRSGLELAAGERTVEAVLERGLTLTGSVLNPSGGPASESMVRVERPGSQGFQFRGPRAYIDDGGQFSIGGLEAGTYTVTARHAEWGTTTETVEIGPTGASVELRFTNEGASVAGLVLDGATGEAIIGADVSLQTPQEAKSFGGGRLRTQTDHQGRFRFSAVSPGSYVPLASHEGYARATGEAIEVGELSIDGLTLELGGGEAIVGAVVGVPFERLGSLSLMAISTSGGLRHGSPDFEGRFSLKNLAPGAWTVRASLPEGAQASERVMLAAGDGEVEIELDLAA
ncbi:MAG: carboxypeptidase regulatory-like domain-containing protein, partial [Acidobacteriota bacterium]